MAHVIAMGDFSSSYYKNLEEGELPPSPALVKREKRRKPHKINRTNEPSHFSDRLIVGREQISYDDLMKPSGQKKSDAGKHKHKHRKSARSRLGVQVDDTETRFEFPPVISYEENTSSDDFYAVVGPKRKIQSSLRARLGLKLDEQPPIEKSCPEPIEIESLQNRGIKKLLKKRCQLAVNSVLQDKSDVDDSVLTTLGSRKIESMGGDDIVITVKDEKKSHGKLSREEKAKLKSILEKRILSIMSNRSFAAESSKRKRVEEEKDSCDFNTAQLKRLKLRLGDKVAPKSPDEPSLDFATTNSPVEISPVNVVARAALPDMVTVTAQATEEPHASEEPANCLLQDESVTKVTVYAENGENEVASDTESVAQGPEEPVLIDYDQNSAMERLMSTNEDFSAESKFESNEMRDEEGDGGRESPEPSEVMPVLCASKDLQLPPTAETIQSQISESISGQCSQDHSGTVITPSPELCDGDNFEIVEMDVEKLVESDDEKPIGNLSVVEAEVSCNLAVVVGVESKMEFMVPASADIQNGLLSNNDVESLENEVPCPVIPKSSEEMIRNEDYLVQSPVMPENDSSCETFVAPTDEPTESTNVETVHPPDENISEAEKSPAILVKPSDEMIGNEDCNVKSPVMPETEASCDSILSTDEPSSNILNVEAVQIPYDDIFQAEEAIKERKNTSEATAVGDKVATTEQLDETLEASLLEFSDDGASLDSETEARLISSPEPLRRNTEAFSGAVTLDLAPALSSIVEEAALDSLSDEYPPLLSREEPPLLSIEDPSLLSREEPPLLSIEKHPMLSIEEPTSLPSEDYSLLSSKYPPLLSREEPCCAVKQPPLSDSPPAAPPVYHLPVIRSCRVVLTRCSARPVPRVMLRRLSSKTIRKYAGRARKESESVKVSKRRDSSKLKQRSTPTKPKGDVQAPIKSQSNVSPVKKGTDSRGDFSRKPTESIKLTSIALSTPPRTESTQPKVESEEARVHKFISSYKIPKKQANVPITPPVISLEPSYSTCVEQEAPIPAASPFSALEPCFMPTAVENDSPSDHTLSSSAATHSPPHEIDQPMADHALCSPPQSIPIQPIVAVVPPTACKRSLVADFDGSSPKRPAESPAKQHTEGGFKFNFDTASLLKKKLANEKVTSESERNVGGTLSSAETPTRLSLEGEKSTPPSTLAPAAASTAETVGPVSETDVVTPLTVTISCGGENPSRHIAAGSPVFSPASSTAIFTSAPLASPSSSSIFPPATRTTSSSTAVPYAPLLVTSSTTIFSAAPSSISPVPPAVTTSTSIFATAPLIPASSTAVTSSTAVISPAPRPFISSPTAIFPAPRPATSSTAFTSSTTRAVTSSTAVISPAPRPFIASPTAIFPAPRPATSSTAVISPAPQTTLPGVRQVQHVRSFSAPVPAAGIVNRNAPNQGVVAPAPLLSADRPWGAPCPGYEYVSEDQEENADNFDRRWGQMRDVSSDVELYRIIRKRWRNLTIPNPARNLTCRHRTYNRAMPRRATQFPRLRTQSCTEAYERRLEILRMETSNALQALDNKQRMAMEQLIARHKFQLSNLNQPNYACDNVYEQWGGRWQQVNNSDYDGVMRLHMNELNDLQDTHAYQREQTEKQLIAEMNKVHAYINEVSSFYRFYQMLNPDSRRDKTMLTEEQVALSDESDQIFEAFKVVYGHN